MVIIDFDAIQRVHAADDIIGHGDHPHLKAAAELEIRLGLPQKEHIGGVAANVDDKGPGSLPQALGPRHHSRIGLGIDHHISDHQADRGAVENEGHPPALKVLGKLLAQLVVLGGKAYRQVRLDDRLSHVRPLHLFGDGKQGEDKEPVILCLVPHIGDTLAGERPELSLKFQHISLHGRLHRIVRQPGGEYEIRGFDGGVAVIDGKQH